MRLKAENSLARLSSVWSAVAVMAPIRRWRSPEGPWVLGASLRNQGLCDLSPDPPPTPGVGSFSDDEEELSKLLASPERASAVDLERLAHLLRLLSDQMTE